MEKGNTIFLLELAKNILKKFVMESVSAKQPKGLKTRHHSIMHGSGLFIC